MMPEWMIFSVAFLAMMLFMAWISINFYKKCPPNTAMIISGMMAGDIGNAFKIVVGGGAVVLPMIQQISYVNLETQNIELKSTTQMTSLDNIPLLLSGTAQIKVKGDAISIATAAELLLGKEPTDVAAIAEQIITASLLQTIASLTASDVVKRPELVSISVQESAIAQLAKMGLTIVTFSITEVRDQVGYLDLLAREEVERKRQQVQS
jgi:flotillin